VLVEKPDELPLMEAAMVEKSFSGAGAAQTGQFKPRPSAPTF